jgi:hypothetical protein
VIVELADVPDPSEELERLIAERRAREERVLWTAEAYDVAFRHLYDLLPDCRGCACALPCPPPALAVVPVSAP